MKKKSILITIIIAMIILVITGSLVFILLNKKNDNGNKIEVFNLVQFDTLSENDSVRASEIVKNNIVKVINKIDGDTSIVGTGFFDKSGYLITNSHLVDIKGTIVVEYPDGNTSEAILYSNDIVSDIALLAVEHPSVKAVSYANTLQLNITDDVYAIGYPFALNGEASVSKGILSARRSAGGIEFLQSDIALNTGNSGGPLINKKGEVLGINTYATANASIGMSISSESLQTIILKLLESKKAFYLEDDRPQNALSVVLSEIGYYHEDIYNEKELIKKRRTDNNDGKHDNGNNNQNNNGKHDNDNNNQNNNGKHDNGNNNQNNNGNNNHNQSNNNLDTVSTTTSSKTTTKKQVIITDIPFGISKIVGSGHIVYDSKLKQNVMRFTYSIVTKDGISPTLEMYGVDLQDYNNTTIDIVEKAIIEIKSNNNDRIVVRKEIPGSSFIIKNGVSNYPYITLNELRNQLTEADIYKPNNQYVLYSSIEVTFKNGKGTYKNGDWSYIDP